MSHDASVFYILLAPFKGEIHGQVRKPCSRYVQIPLLTITCTWAWLVLALTLAPSVQAQEIGRVGDVIATDVPYYVFTRPGAPTVQVYVIGAGASGIYEVSAGTGLDELLALAAGVPGVPESRERREVTLRLFRETAGTRTVVYEEGLRQFLSAGSETYPTLQEGDIFEVEVVLEPRFGWREGLTIFSSLTSLALLLERILD